MKIFKSLEKLFVAITFAEHGEVEEAQRIMAEQDKSTVVKSQEKESGVTSAPIRAKA